MPSIDAPDDKANEFLNPVIQLCGDFWCMLLEQMTRTSSAPKAGKVLVTAIVNELVAAAWQAEWPGAQLLLYVLCNHLKDVVHGGAPRAGKADASVREERELLLEVVGHLIAQVCLYDNAVLSSVRHQQRFCVCWPLHRIVAEPASVTSHAGSRLWMMVYSVCKAYAYSVSDGQYVAWSTLVNNDAVQVSSSGVVTTADLQLMLSAPVLRQFCADVAIVQQK